MTETEYHFHQTAAAKCAVQVLLMRTTDAEIPEITVSIIKDWQDMLAYHASKAGCLDFYITKKYLDAPQPTTGD